MPEEIDQQRIDLHAMILGRTPRKRKDSRRIVGVQNFLNERAVYTYAPERGLAQQLFDGRQNYSSLTTCTGSSTETSLWSRIATLKSPSVLIGSSSATLRRSIE
jgi:hypothetical protein